MIVEGYQIQKSIGSFSDTLIYKDRLEKDYYDSNPYTVYCGSDYAWQRIVNQNSTNDKKILLIQDSFANCVKPYLALNTSEIYSVDLREKMFGEYRIESLSELVESFKPDYVVINNITRDQPPRQRHFDFVLSEIKKGLSSDMHLITSEQGKLGKWGVLFFFLTRLLIKLVTSSPRNPTSARTHRFGS